LERACTVDDKRVQDCFERSASSSFIVDCRRSLPSLIVSVHCRRSLSSFIIVVFVKTTVHTINTDNEMRMPFVGPNNLLSEWINGKAVLATHFISHCHDDARRKTQNRIRWVNKPFVTPVPAKMQNRIEIQRARHNIVRSRQRSFVVLSMRGRSVLLSLLFCRSVWWPPPFEENLFLFKRSRILLQQKSTYLLFSAEIFASLWILLRT
jgi:hypothetical protein